MIDVKDAARIAAEYFFSLYDRGQYTNVLLEEVELTDDDRHWLITLGYDEPPTGVAALAAIPSFNYSPIRGYKTFRIDAESGVVRSMKVRNVA